MNIDAEMQLRSILCQQWCDGLEIDAKDSAGIRLSLPLVEADGDELTVWLHRELGGWRISDCGTTMMRLSYHISLDDIAEGARARVLSQIQAEHDVEFSEGIFSIVTPEASLNEALLRLGQTMLRSGDVALWTRQLVATQFYDDLRRELERIVGRDRLRREYYVPELPEAESYPIDFAVVDGVPKPFYIFGVPGGDKAKLATIILQHLRAARQTFESLVIFAGVESVPRPDFRRLMNAAGEMVDSLQAQDAIEQKVRLRIAV